MTVVATDGHRLAMAKGDLISDKLGKDGLYTAILYPSAGIEHGYEGHVVKIKGGDEIVGIRVGETQDELTLRIAGGLVNSYKKSDVTARRVGTHVEVAVEDDGPGIRAEQVDHLERIDAVAERLRHLATLYIAHRTSQIHIAERQLTHELEAGHDHTRDPEEQDLRRSHQRVRRIERLQVVGLLRPAECRERPEP